MLQAEKHDVATARDLAGAAPEKRASVSGASTGWASAIGRPPGSGWSRPLGHLGMLQQQTEQLAAGVAGGSHDRDSHAPARASAGGDTANSVVAARP